MTLWTTSCWSLFYCYDMTLWTTSKLSLSLLLWLSVLNPAWAFLTTMTLYEILPEPFLLSWLSVIHPTWTFPTAMTLYITFYLNISYCYDSLYYILLEHFLLQWLYITFYLNLSYCYDSLHYILQEPFLLPRLSNTSCLSFSYCYDSLYYIIHESFLLLLDLYIKPNIFCWYGSLYWDNLWQAWTVVHRVVSIKIHFQTIHGIKSHLKLPSLFTAWLFWTFHTKSHNMKALVILSHSWSPFLPLTCLYGKNPLLWVFVRHSGVFSWEKNHSRFPMQIT